MGFDATCSLVLVGEGDSVVVEEEGGREDIVMWMDHRAKEQAEAINATKHQVVHHCTVSRVPPLSSSCWTMWGEESP